MKQLEEHGYEKQELKHGYANRTLHIDVGSRAITEKPVTDAMKEVFVGGRGFDLWLLWNSIPPQTKWDEPVNEVVIGSGPLAGSPIYPGSGKSICCAISPLTGSVIDSNVGGYFGPYLKFSGFDALELQGKSEVPLVVLIDGDQGKITFFDGSELTDNAYQLSQELHEHGGLYAATGLAAAWLLTRFAGFRLVTVFIAEHLSPDLAARLRFREEGRGSNVWLVIPKDEGVFHGVAYRDGVACVHPVQAYLLATCDKEW